MKKGYANGLLLLRRLEKREVNSRNVLRDIHIFEVLGDILLIKAHLRYLNLPSVKPYVALCHRKAFQIERLNHLC